MKRNKIFCLLLVLLLLGVSLFSQERKATKDGKRERFEISSDKTTVELSEGKERTVLTGNATVVTGATTINANKIELFGKNFTYALCSGGVTVKDSAKGIYLRCEQLFYDREKKISRIEGYAEMLDKANNMTVKGNYLQDDSESETTLIQIGVRIIKEDIVCRAESAKYDRKTKNLELTGKPLVIKKGDEYRATRIVLNVESDEIALEGGVSAKMKQEDKEE